MELTRKTWEKSKDWLVTGKGLSTALDAYNVVKARAKVSKTKEDWTAVLMAVKEVGAQINKNLAKLDKKAHKDTCQLLSQFYLLAKTESDQAVAEAQAAVNRAAIMSQIAGYEEMVEKFTAKRTAATAALAKLKVDVAKALAHLAPTNAEARKMIRDHLSKTAVDPIRSAYATTENAPRTLRTIATMHSPETFTAAQQAQIAKVCADMNTLAASFRQLKVGAEAELDKIK